MGLLVDSGAFTHSHQLTLPFDIVAMLTACLALTGTYVDVISSSYHLAKCDGELIVLNKGPFELINERGILFGRSHEDDRCR